MNQENRITFHFVKNPLTFLHMLTNVFTQSQAGSGSYVIQNQSLSLLKISRLFHLIQVWHPIHPLLSENFNLPPLPTGPGCDRGRDRQGMGRRRKISSTFAQAFDIITAKRPRKENKVFSVFLPYQHCIFVGFRVHPVRNDGPLPCSPAYGGITSKNNSGGV